MEKVARKRNKTENRREKRHGAVIFSLQAIPKQRKNPEQLGDGGKIFAYEAGIVTFDGFSQRLKRNL